MASFLDYYTRLSRYNGDFVKVVYYEDNIWKKLEGRLLKTLGCDCVVVDYNDEERRIPFFKEGCIIQSINIIFGDQDERDLMDGGVLFLNPYDVSKISSEDKEKKEEIFGTVIHYGEGKYLDYFDDWKVNYYKLFSTSKQRETFFNFLESVITDIIINYLQDVSNSRLSLIGLGSSSFVYSIGDKIVKFGTPRKKIPYCEFYLQPITNYEEDFDGAKIQVEVTQNASVDCDTAVLEQIADYLEKELKNIGLDWYDSFKWNVGLLETREDNCIHYGDNISFKFASDSVTSILFNDIHSLDGESKPFLGHFPVIIDLDCVRIADVDKYTEYLLGKGFKDVDRYVEYLQQEEFSDDVIQKVRQQFANSMKR